MTVHLENTGPAPLPGRWAPYLLSVLRIVAAFLFIAHGTQKWFGIPGTGTTPIPFEPGSLLGVAAMLETIGGTLLLLGLFTRPVAFVLAGEMAVAYFRTHAPNGFWPTINHGEPAVLFCFLYLYLAAAGGGAWALDTLRRSASA